MRIFDTNVQKLKYDVLREVARHAYEDTLQDAYLDIPKTIAPGPEPTMRCCVYKERVSGHVRKMRRRSESILPHARRTSAE